MDSEAARLPCPHLFSATRPARQAIIERDRKVLEPATTRDYPVIVIMAKVPSSNDVDFFAAQLRFQRRELLWHPQGQCIRHVVKGERRPPG